MPDNQGLHLVLVTPEIPANTGNIVRLCAATGVHLHLIEPLGFQMDDRVLKRAGLDYWKDCRLTKHLTFEEVEAEFPTARYYFLSARARASFFDHLIEAGDVLVLGAESTGLSKRFLEKNQRQQRTFCLPMPGRGRSLNLSNTASVVVYESLRQMGLLNTPSE